MAQNESETSDEAHAVNELHFPGSGKVVTTLRRFKLDGPQMYWVTALEVGI